MKPKPGLPQNVRLSEGLGLTGEIDCNWKMTVAKGMAEVKAVVTMIELVLEIALLWNEGVDVYGW